MSPDAHDFEPDHEDFNPDPDELCPNCVRDVIDPTSFYGWCRRCSTRRPVTLKTGRQQRWRGAVKAKVAQ